MSLFSRSIYLILGIFLAGWLGLALAVPPGYASPLWPPAGIAIAALLLWGRRLAGVIFLGALSDQLLAGYLAHTPYTFSSLLTFCTIALGSTLQALLGHWLTEKCLGKHVPRLDNAMQAILFFTLSGPLACLVGSTIGTTCIVLAGILPESQFSDAWLNWWVGDVLGVLIICPLFFCFFAQPRELWVRRRLYVALPMLGTIVALALVFIQVYQAEKFRIQMLFDNQADKIGRLLLDHASTLVNDALTIRDFYYSSERTSVDRNQFGIFTRSVLQKHPEIHAIEWLPRVAHEDLAQFEQTIRNEGYKTFRVVEKMDNARLPVNMRSEYFPITFIEPMQENQHALGFDLKSNPGNASLDFFSTKTDIPIISTSSHSLEQPEKTIVQLFIPIYTGGYKTSNQDTLQGIIAVLIQPRRMVEVALHSLDTQNFSIHLNDVDKNLIFTNLYSQYRGHLNENYELKNWKHTAQFYDRTWETIISPNNDFLSIYGSILPWLTLTGGLFFTSLLSILLLTTTGRQAYIEELVNSRTAELRSTEAQLRTVIESQPDCIKLLASNGSLLQMNPAGLEIIGAESLEQAQKLSLLNLIVPEHRAEFIDSIHRVFQGETVATEFEIISLDNRRIWLESHAVPMRTPEGTINAMLSVTRDVTERKQNEENKKLAARVFGEAHEGILITNAHGRIVDVNPTFCEITGYSREEVIGCNPSILQSGRHNAEFYKDMWDALQTRQHWRGEIWNRKKNGELYAELLSISVLLDEHGQILYYLALFSDITESKQQQQMLELLAHYDPLTGVANRTLFADRLIQAIAHARRDHSLLAVCFLDLDGFKPVNDQFGHEVGDQVLIEVAERIKQNLREIDTVSRHGGDEFALLLGNLHTQDECILAIERIHQAIAIPFNVNDQIINIGVSSGITLYPLDSSDPDTLVRHADHAMYQAKLSGKNRYYFFDANQDQEVIYRYKQIQEIGKAFDERQFCLYYQPKVNLKTGRVIGAEALIRWIHPQHGMIPPMDFIPVIANHDLEIQIGNWVIEQAWRQLCDWHAQGLKIGISVNISSKQLLHSHFITHLTKTLETQPQIDSSFLEIEILESSAFDDVATVNKIIKSARSELGVTASLDDFGTGYSSLTHLRHLPICNVKIDQSFVRDMLDDADDFAIVEGVLSLCESFNRQAIAEGVETHELGTVLLLMGCELAQGYAIAKPMPAKELMTWVHGFQPHPDWLFYARQELTHEQSMIKILQIELNHWLKRIQQYIPSNHSMFWPSIKPTKDHFKSWLKNTERLGISNHQQLQKMAKLHDEFMKVSYEIVNLSIDGNNDEALERFDDLSSIHKRLEEHLTRFSKARIPQDQASIDHTEVI